MLRIPIIYKTDNGPPFNSNDFASLAKRLGFKHRLITPYWPRANGEVELGLLNEV
jgi:transposase InsO family protein